MTKNAFRARKTAVAKQIRVIDKAVLKLNSVVRAVANAAPALSHPSISLFTGLLLSWRPHAVARTARLQSRQAICPSGKARGWWRRARCSPKSWSDVLRDLPFGTFVHCMPPELHVKFGMADTSHLGVTFGWMVRTRRTYNRMKRYLMEARVRIPVGCRNAVTFYEREVACIDDLLGDRYKLAAWLTSSAAPVVTVPDVIVSRFVSQDGTLIDTVALKLATAGARADLQARRQSSARQLAKWRAVVERIESGLELVPVTRKRVHIADFIKVGTRVQDAAAKPAAVPVAAAPLVAAGSDVAPAPAAAPSESSSSSDNEDNDSSSISTGSRDSDEVSSGDDDGGGSVAEAGSGIDAD